MKLETVKSRLIELQIIEALLISFEFNAEAKKFTLITDTVNFDLEKMKREFVNIQFDEVLQFKRLSGSNINLQKYREKFNLNWIEGAVSLQWLEIQKFKKELYKVNLHFGDSFGDIEIAFKSLKVQKKMGVAKEKGEGDWEYMDLKTGSVFDFYNPF